MTASNGRIIDIYGLFEANKNDAKIMNEILETKKDLLDLLQPNDIIIVDRGFRDCISNLENHSLQPKMPACLEKNQKQLNTEQANQSCLVTKCRWVVEVTNSFLKNSFKALDNVKNKSLHHTLKDYRIAAALINKYFNRLYSDNDDVIIAKRMKAKLFKENNLEKYVIENKLHLKKLYNRIDALAITDFPRLTKEEIISHITFGTYQIRQSLSYLDEHMSEKKYDILVGKETLEYDKAKLLLANIQSRHRGSTKYKCYITYFPSINTVESIEGWYCTCPYGKRTMGCCVHITSIIYYLSYLKYNSDIPKPATDLSAFFETCIDESETDDDDEVETQKNDDDEENLIITKSKSTKSKYIKKSNLIESDDECLEDDLERSFEETMNQNATRLKLSLTIDLLTEEKK